MLDARWLSDTGDDKHVLNFFNDFSPKVLFDDVQGHIKRTYPARAGIEPITNGKNMV